MRLCIFILVLFAACTLTKEEKFSTAIREIEKIYFISNGEKVESLEIDSLHYADATMKDFYVMERKRQLNLANESREAIATMTGPKDSTQIRKMGDENNKRQDIISKIDALIGLNSASNKLYRVNYKIRAVTDKSPYTLHREKFLTREGLKEIKLDASFFD